MKQTCPNCRTVFSTLDAERPKREPGQHGSTWCPVCGETTPNRAWSDFETELTPEELMAMDARRLAQAGMVALKPEEFPALCAMATATTRGDSPGDVTQALACIVAGHVLEAVLGNRALEKKVKLALTAPEGSA